MGLGRAVGGPFGVCLLRPGRDGWARACLHEACIPEEMQHTQRVPRHTRLHKVNSDGDRCLKGWRWAVGCGGWEGGMCPRPQR